MAATTRHISEDMHLAVAPPVPNHAPNSASPQKESPKQQPTKQGIVDDEDDNDEGQSIPLPNAYQTPLLSPGLSPSSDASILRLSQQSARPSELYSRRTFQFVSQVTTPCTSVGAALQALQDDNAFSRLERGIRVQKVTSRGKLRPRTLTLSKDRFALFVTHQPIKNKKKKDKSKKQQAGALPPSPTRAPREGGVLSTEASRRLHVPLVSRKGFRGYVFFQGSSRQQTSLQEKYVRYIDLADLSGLQVGVVGTQKLELARTENRLKGRDSPQLDGPAASPRIVSLLHHGGRQTLDVLIPRRADRLALIECLRQLRATYHAAKVWVTNEALLLRYIWYDIDVDRNGGIGQREFATLLQRINLRWAHPEREFQAYLQEINAQLAAQAAAAATATGNSPLRRTFRKSRGGARRTTLPKQYRPRDSLTYGQVMTLLQRLKRKCNSTRGGSGGGGGGIAALLWKKHFHNHPSVSVAVFLEFLHKVQGMDQLTLDDAQELLAALTTLELNNHADDDYEDLELLMGTQTSESQQLKALGPDQLTRARFEIYLFTAWNDAYDPVAVSDDSDKQQLTFDRPLSHYWIHSSHNTYLTGDQFRSSSSAEMYLAALRRGCKCLELDCWDGETVSQKQKSRKAPRTKKSSSSLAQSTAVSPASLHYPVVYHGRTLTSKILFADVLRCVQSYLVSNPQTLPIILSLENHCSPPFQRAMAHDLETILGDSLYLPPPQTALTSSLLPSPGALRGKVIIKGKRPPNRETNGERGEGGEEDDEEEYDDYDPHESGNTGQPQSVSTTTTGSRRRRNRVEPALARLTLFHGSKFNSFAQSLTEPASHMHSMSETKVSKLAGASSNTTIDWRRYNQGHVTRTYPAGRRVDSSNYNPMLAWATGCQLVALNLQTPDTAVVLNDGRFRQGHHHMLQGYVLKPPSVLGMQDATTVAKNIKSADSTVLAREETTASADKAVSALGARQDSDYGDDMLESVVFDSAMQSMEDFVCGAEQSTRSVTDWAAASLTQTKRLSGARMRVSDRLAATQSNLQDSTVVVQPLRLRIRVLAGSCLPKPEGAKLGETIDPYVLVTLHDVKEERSTGRLSYVTASFGTKAIDNNGFCPMWTTATSPQNYKELHVLNPQVAMLQFTLKEQDIGGILDDRVAEAAIPCHCLRCGYRSVQLLDPCTNTRSGPFGFASLLVELHISNL